MRFYNKVITAISERNDEKLNVLFKQSDANPNDKEFLDTRHGGSFGHTLISGVIQKLRDYDDDIIIFYVEYLTKKGALINAKIGMDGATPLSFATLYNKVKLVAYLLQRGAEINNLTFSLACHNCNLAIVIVFANKAKLTANFSDVNFGKIPGNSLEVHWLEKDNKEYYTP